MTPKPHPNDRTCMVSVIAAALIIWVIGVFAEWIRR